VIPALRRKALERMGRAAYRGDIDTGHTPDQRPEDTAMNRLSPALLNTPRFTAFACAALCTLMTLAGIEALALAETTPLWLAHAAPSVTTSAAPSAIPFSGA
jgi:hypothetical protein